MNALLEVRDVSHSFGGLRVLQGVTLDVAEGAITGLIGPNGAGKSTLFNIISGFLKPSAGEIVYAGETITRQSVQARSEKGLLRSFQTPQVFGDLTVCENLVAGFHRKGSSGVIAGMLGLPVIARERRASEAEARRIAREFALEDVAEKLARDLPAGRQRMVELARAAIARPRLLCLDEPSSGLSADEVQDLMRRLRDLKAQGVTILLVSHDMELMGVSDMMHALCFGEVIASGDLKQMQSDERVREAYLGV